MVKQTLIQVLTSPLRIPEPDGEVDIHLEFECDTSAGSCLRASLKFIPESAVKCNLRDGRHPPLFGGRVRCAHH